MYHVSIETTITSSLPFLSSLMMSHACLCVFRAASNNNNAIHGHAHQDSARDVIIIATSFTFVMFHAEVENSPAMQHWLDAAAYFYLLKLKSDYFD